MEAFQRWAVMTQKFKSVRAKANLSVKHRAPRRQLASDDHRKSVAHGSATGDHTFWQKNARVETRLPLANDRLPGLPGEALPATETGGVGRG